MTTRSKHNPNMGRPPVLGPGDECGVWRVVARTDERLHTQVVLEVECVDCGGVKRLRSADVRRKKCCQPRKPPRRQRCSTCGQPGHRRDQCEDFNPDMPWKQDVETRVLVRLWGRMALHEVGDLWGLSHERIRQIEERALRRFAKRCRLAGIRAEDVHAHFADKQPTTWEEIALLDTGA